MSILALTEITLLTEIASTPVATTEILAPMWMCHMWFVLLCVLLAGYAILDGFDLGVGIIHFIVGHNEKERELHASVIGPVWDGNEVWLVTFGGALFAAFPLAYGTIFSAFMVPLMIVLFCLILRATSLEFRSKANSPFLKRVCDVGFCFASLLATFIFGVSVAALMEGIPIDNAGTLILPGEGTPAGAGPFEELTFALTPLSVSSGVLAITLFALHGSLFLNLKTTGRLQTRIQKLFPYFYSAFVLAFVTTTIIAFQSIGAGTLTGPWAILVAIMNILAVLNLPRAMYRGKPWSAFLSSCCVVVALIFLFGKAVHPNLAISSINSDWNITIFDAASTRATLLTMFVVVCFAIPFVMLYTAITYWTFRGTVSIPDEDLESDS